ncbi:hypothetical protein KIL84_012377 [Mauremys mutica]|uniref:Uncharacterized protein n=1 Tax=Mauremys mutica TaxID=74926 RepID=A0A9D3XGE8_9SAUR|nr:hypothetical protein KIL84_012377 [Mauremys mutica]
MQLSNVSEARSQVLQGPVRSHVQDFICFMLKKDAALTYFYHLMYPFGFWSHPPPNRVKTKGLILQDAEHPALIQQSTCLTFPLKSMKPLMRLKLSTWKSTLLDWGHSAQHIAGSCHKNGDSYSSKHFGQKGEKTPLPVPGWRGENRNSGFLSDLYSFVLHSDTTVNSRAQTERVRKIHTGVFALQTADLACKFCTMSSVLKTSGLTIIFMLVGWGRDVTKRKGNESQTQLIEKS